MSDEEKLFYTIGEVAQVVNVKPYVLRYWETEFKKLDPQKSPTGQRTYRQKDIQIALAIKKLLYDEKYTIAGAIQKLDEMEKAGLDQVDMFAAKPAEPAPEKEPVAEERPKAVAAKFDLALEENSKHEQLEPHAPVHSPEKVEGFLRLLDHSKGILKKYDLA